MAVITIDGMLLEAGENQSVLECALEGGIYIPHLCHHPDLPELGSCRMCIVEVEGEGNVMASCMLKAKDGMVIRTKSERIDKLRTLALDLLLSCHPEDCSSCPKYGNCELQTLIQYMGGAGTRMKRRVKGFKTVEQNPLIIHDMNRCVLCGRCVRACNDLRGVGVLQYKKKDMEIYVGTLHDKLLKKEDCRFCQACVEVCPTGTIRDKLKENEVEKPKEDMIVPCRAACPAHIDIPAYIRLVKEGRFDEAAAVVREKVPFPLILGYVCNHVCELACKRKELNEAMSIRNIKRFAAEADTGSCWKGKIKQKENTGKKVCVVGSGPAGMTAAYYLKRQGHSVIVKEALSEAGGMLRFGIPEYRLPTEIIEKEYQYIEDLGVQVQLNTKVKNLAQLKTEYDAVLICIGTHKGVRLPIEGNELSGVILNTDFLRKARLKQETGIGEQVIVLGGGNVAFDCARTAKRLGAREVNLACLEAREKMTADEEEILQAQEEGIHIYPAQTFEKIIGETNVEGVEFSNVLTFSFDENHRPVIKKEENSKHCIKGDTVIFATGQRPNIPEQFGLTLGRGNCILVKGETLETNEYGVFAAGDAVYGTKSVIEAIVSGRKAAMEIDKYLGGDGNISEQLVPEEETDSYIGKIKDFAYEKRAEAVIVPAKERKDNFKPVDLGICKEDICKEAGRCLQCDLRLKIKAPRLWDDYTSEEGNS